MISNDKGDLVCCCDSCGAEQYAGCQDSFRAFVDELKEQGWKIGKDDDGAWTHCCPECSEGDS